MAYNGIKITDVTVHPIAQNREGNSLQAFARVVLNDQFVINSIRVLNGKYGHFIAFPQDYKSHEKKKGTEKEEKRAYSFCFPITKELHAYISHEILERFQHMVPA